MDDGQPKAFGTANHVDGLELSIQRGLLLIGCTAFFSAIAVCALLTSIIYRFFTWRRCPRQSLGYNQCVVLISNLLVADLFQGIALVISLYWYGMDAIQDRTVACWLQAGFLQFGDVASAMLVLLITAHSIYQVGFGGSIGYYQFYALIVGIWLFALVLELIGPLYFGGSFFARAENWVSHHSYTRLTNTTVLDLTILRGRTPLAPRSMDIPRGIHHHRLVRRPLNLHRTPNPRFETPLHHLVAIRQDGPRRPLHDLLPTRLRSMYTSARHLSRHHPHWRQSIEHICRHCRLPVCVVRLGPRVGFYTNVSRFPACRLERSRSPREYRS